MKFFINIFLLLSSQISLGQNKQSYYLSVIKKGFCEDSSKSCINKQYKYLTACDWLGNYFYRNKAYHKAFKYYELPLELNGHSTTIQTDSAYHLRNNIIAKAGDMLFFGHGFPKDTVNSFYYHFQYPVTYKFEQKNKYSFLYFRTIQDTFNLAPTETNLNEYFIAINPFMLSENTVLLKIANAINILSINKSKISITLFKGDIQLSEELQALLYRSLDNTKEFINLEGNKISIETDVDLAEYKITKIVNGFSFPIYKISVH